ncbi:MAG: RNA 2',3'-cyclic phosphodiesterase [Chloroflexota bacterium]|nr:RNA 2',3'-cyclic phosphodiesterase [Chloroflexota bacterium]MDH5244326.1 RNA 2',3'-cyclic phosphodiesterase [Chloroflexota bacterium]
MTRPGRWVDPYAGIQGRRLFVAVPLPDTAVAAVAGIVDSVRAQPLPAGAHDVRWVRLDGLHLTLRFLGPTATPQIEPTRSAVERAAEVAAPISAELGSAGVFPPAGRPRALWIGVAVGGDELAGLAAVVNRELAEAGWPIDERPFRAHLTVARADGVGAGRLVADRLITAIGDRRIDCAIDRLGLFESVTGGGPARYLPVFEAPLGAPGRDVGRDRGAADRRP